MTDHLPDSPPVPGRAEPTRQDPGFAVDPAGRALDLPPVATHSPASPPTRPPGPSARAWRRVGLVAGLVVVGSGVLNLSPVLGSTHEARVAFAADLSVLRIESGSGDVVVRPVAPGETPGAVARVRGWGGPGPLALEGTTLRTTNLCDPIPVGCDVRLEVAVPDGVALTIDGGSGDVSASELTGPVDVRMGSGDIDLVGISGASVDALATSGDVSLTDIRATRIGAETSSGDVTVTLAADAGEVRATASSGDVRVEVPQGATTWDTSAETSSGDVTNEIGDVPGAEHRIVAETSSGDVDLLRR